MSTIDTSFIKLGDASNAPILSYNVPDSTSYEGRSYIELSIPAAYFKESLREVTPGMSTVIDGMDSKELGLEMKRASEGKPFKNAALTRFADVKELSSYEISGKELAANMEHGKRPVVVSSMYGDKHVEFFPDEKEQHFKIMLVETYKLSSFLGNYGAGRTLKTFSLLPGEKTKITVKSYSRSKEISKQTSSIFDSYNRESSNAFERELAAEHSNKDTQSKGRSYHAEAKASGSFFGAKLEASAGLKGNSNKTREEFSKNIQNTTSKHAAKASAKRDIQINTSSESETEVGEEMAIERVLENVNVSRTLNFVFRQMNQEFITLLHLTDVRIAFTDQLPLSYSEAPISDLDEFLSKYIVLSKLDEVKRMVLEELQSIEDYQGNVHSLVEEHQVNVSGGNGAKYWRVRKEVLSHYKTDPANEDALIISVPGILLSDSRSVLRTEGVVVEAILGQGNALDNYSIGLQTESVNEQALKNKLLELEAAKLKMGLEIVANKDEASAKLYESLFPATTPEQEE